MIREIDDIRVNIYQHGENGPCFYVAESDREAGSVDNLAERLAEKAGDAAYSLIVYEVAGWNSQLSPWPARAAFGEKMFAGRGAETLAWLTDKCIPRLREEKMIPEGVSQYTAGYSLSGLFALWAILESDVFDGAASCSGSLWIDGWMEYIRDKKLSNNALIYLSLGSKEERTKNPLMSKVGDCTRETYESLKKNPAVKKITLQWNKGGHFADTDTRLVNGILWLLQAQRRGKTAEK
ncbi:MAG: alpha/beta hydrolase [Lachnospiraceae bacterium]|nr:alpha/beta hydrolase [Lachnospiraceae bacterium]